PPPRAAGGAFQQRNFALARLTAEAYLESLGERASDTARRERAVREAALSTEGRGRLRVVNKHPLTVPDGAHNPAAVAALVDSLPDVIAGRPLTLVLG